MVRLTFDTNCIIDLEEQRPDSKYLREIIDAWRNKKVEVAVVAVSASENQPHGRVNETYQQFEEKLEAVGLKGATELLPLAYWDVFYWDRALWSNKGMEDLEEKIRNVLFPGIQTEAPKSDKEARIWRNKLCDVLVAWSHAYHQWDVLVTRDQNFHKKKEGLSRLGVKQVMYPSEAVKLCRP